MKFLSTIISLSFLGSIAFICPTFASSGGKSSRRLAKTKKDVAGYYYISQYPYYQRPQVTYDQRSTKTGGGGGYYYLPTRPQNSINYYYFQPQNTSKHKKSSNNNSNNLYYYKDYYYNYNFNQQERPKKQAKKGAFGGVGSDTTKNHKSDAAKTTKAPKNPDNDDIDDDDDTNGDNGDDYAYDDDKNGHDGEDGSTSSWRKPCRLCDGDWAVPNPGKILLDKTCSYWNNRGARRQDCQDIKATFGGACGCDSPPVPTCNVCPDGDYIFLEENTSNPGYNSFVDDYCVRMIFRLSKFANSICSGSKDDVAKMCCVNTCPARKVVDPNNPVQKRPKKKVAIYTDGKSSKKSSKSKKGSRSNDVASYAYYGRPYRPYSTYRGTYY